MSQNAPPPRSWLDRVGAIVRPSTPPSALPEPSAAAGGDSERQLLKAAVARKRRNDAVRNDELNHLRELMRARWAAHERDGLPAPSSGLSDLSTLSPLSSSLQLDVGPGAFRNRTINEIARIESQMSQHWLQRGLGPEAGGARIVSTRLAQTLERDLSQSKHLRARAKPAAALPIDVVTEDQPFTVQELSAALSEPELTQAAQAFALGKDAAVERALRALMVQKPLSLAARVAAMALLDFFHARGEVEPFDELAAEFADRFGTPVPRWPTEAGRVLHPSTQTEPSGTQDSSWVCPLFLDLQAVAALEQTMAAPGSPKWLDWTGLLSADLPAARALLVLVQGWLQRPLDLRMVGAAVLRRRLKASTPSGRSENDAVWWQLRLALLCLMRRRDEFDLAALDYCVTYGVLPPEWVQPQCRCVAADSLPTAAAGTASARAEAAPPQPLAAGAAAALEPLAWPDLPAERANAQAEFGLTHHADWPAALTLLSQAAPTLSGQLGAGNADLLGALDAALVQHPPGTPFILDCRGLLRVDLVAASALMQCLLTARQRGVAVELHGLSRLLAAYLHTVGINEVATLRLRQY